MTVSNATSGRTAAAARRQGTGASSSSTAEGYSLTGPSLPLDPRVHAYRRDLADIGLAGRIIAPHYARPLPRGCGAHAAFVHGSPEEDSDPLSELLPGEGFLVLEYAGGHAWGYCEGDRLVGYVDAVALAEPVDATHVVCERTAPVAAGPGIAAPVLATMPLGARLNGAEQGGCLATEYGCVPLSHLRRADEPEADPVIVAERLLGAPWKGGGRSHAGIDGVGLVQLALGLSGVAAPRLLDSLRTLGEPVPSGARMRRGDLVLCDEDAGLMIDDLMMIHACPGAGKVRVDPVSLAEPAGLERRRL